MNKHEVEEMLAVPCHIEFIKANGEIREMIGTRNINLIPTEHHPKGTGRVENPDVVKVFDLEKSGWRSFRLDRLNEIHAINS